MDADGASAQPYRPPVSSVLTLDFERLKSKLGGYLKPEDLGRVEAAYHFSADAHLGQFRVSGEPYISHPVAVADIIADW
ncbi:MAG: guanosine-3',5'-bis(diphosphate) 3'-pyrophosphohydrolase, partial [Thauera phenolivorans]|nr:guanosine-3',5'-bis(diphosphate) 3'-pyrophosphohydrolase [Thauera phenolivorans]